MEEDATGEALQKACHIVRQVIGRNVENFINTRIRSIDERITQTTYNIGKRNRQKEKKKEKSTPTLASFQERRKDLTSRFDTFQEMIMSEKSGESLNSIIIKYLETGVDPEYLGCDNSFQDVDAVLKNAGVYLDEGTHTLKILTESENKEKIKKTARSVVRPIVQGNVLDFVNAHAKEDPDLYVAFHNFQRERFDHPSINELNEAIINCLRGKETLNYLDCQDSFQGVKTALKDAGIVLSKKGNLRFLTAEEKLMDEFELIGLETEGR
jgi:hypothetical protein